MQGSLRYTFSKLKALEFIFDLMINHNETLASRTILDLSPRIRYQNQILLHIQNRRECPLPLTTLSFMHMENEAAGIQKCVQFEHTGGRR